MHLFRVLHLLGVHYLSYIHRPFCLLQVDHTLKETVTVMAERMGNIQMFISLSAVLCIGTRNKAALSSIEEVENASFLMVKFIIIGK